MLFSFAILFGAGLLLGKLCEKIKLPSLLGMLVAGILIGPYGLNALDESVLDISTQLRKIALIVILIRAGLNLDLADLKRAGRPAILMCFVPAVFEIAATTLLAPLVFPLSRLDAALAGCVLAAVSPAVIVPHMLKVMESGRGVKQSIPQMILAGASADDIVVLVLFSVVLSMQSGQGVDLSTFWRIPTSIGFGIAGGIATGWLLLQGFKRWKLNPVEEVLVYLSVCFLLVTLEDKLNGPVAFSGLVATMVAGMVVARQNQKKAKSLSTSFSSIWTMAQIVLFVLVGASVNVAFATRSFLPALVLILGVLLVRMAGVWCCLLGTGLHRKEKAFCMIAYMPKATVQAAIGAVPLSMGLACGETILTIAVTAILVTAPLGAFFIDRTYSSWLRL